MHRFFIDSVPLLPGEMNLPPEQSRQITRVLRLHQGDSILLLDNRGSQFKAEILTAAGGDCSVNLGDPSPTDGEPRIHLTLLLGLTQREKFELILQKVTEIGASTIIPVVTSRTLVQKAADVANKYPRWQKIIREAAEQSHRGLIPTLTPVKTLRAALSEVDQQGLRLTLWEDEEFTTLKQELAGFSGESVTLFIGPEGGLSAAEVDLARSHGFTPVTLGRRILRMETAAILACGLVLFELD